MHVLPIQPLATDRLLLRKARPDDLDTLHALWNEPLVRRFLFDDRVVTRELARQTLEHCLALDPSAGGLWLILIQREARMIGCAGLMPSGVVATLEPRLDGLLEPLVAVHPNTWRQGFAGEALAALLRHAFEALHRPAVGAACDVPNEASLRMLGRAGFEVLGEVAGPLHALRTFVLPAAHWRQRRSLDAVHR
jgi:[ribosomal protein S5]-alanine N-acetyltransferase